MKVKIAKQFLKEERFLKMENKYSNSCGVCDIVAGNKTNTRRSNRTKVQKTPHKTLSANNWAEP